MTVFYPLDTVRVILQGKNMIRYIIIFLILYRRRCLSFGVHVEFIKFADDWVKLLVSALFQLTMKQSTKRWCK